MTACLVLGPVVTARRALGPTSSRSVRPFQGNGTNMQPRDYNRATGKNRTILIPETEDGLSDTISPQAFEKNHFLCDFRKRLFEMQLYGLSIKTQEGSVRGTRSRHLTTAGRGFLQGALQPPGRRFP